MRRIIAVFTALVPACVAGIPEQAIRSTAAKAVTLVQASQKTWYARQECTSCHNQILPALAFRVAREHGIPVDEAAARADAAKSGATFASLDRAVEYTHFIDAAMDDAFHMVAADAMGVKPSLATAVYARLIAVRQQPEGFWRTIDARPPQSNSFVSATAFSLRALQLYGQQSLASDTKDRVARARAWLAVQHVRNTEERIFQLLGLLWAGASMQDRKALASELLAAQRDDGGWNSVAGRESDAYSTGQALVALHDAGAVPVTDAHWMRGLQYLIESQKPDGSWHVASRMVTPVQVSPPYFESGYPYGHDQFISLMGASWAIMALAEALGPAKPVTLPALTEADPKDVQPWMETILFGSERDVKKLLDGGFDPNSATPGGTTALMMAMPDLAKAKLLVARGAAVNARSKAKYSALLVAAQYPDSIAVTRFLLDKGADTALPRGAGKPLFNATGLSLATMSGDAELIKLYASRGERFDLPFVYLGMFPGMPASTPVTNGDVKTTTALLDAGMPVDLVMPNGMTFLGLAALSNRPETAQLLISRGADVNHVDRYGLTPLQIAASTDFGDSKVIELLKKAGAKKDARDKQGLTALDLARKYRHSNLIASLEN